DDEPGVGEHRDTHDPAHQLDGRHGVLLTAESRRSVGAWEGGAGLLQDVADRRAEDDDEAEGLEGAGESFTDEAGDARGDDFTIGILRVEQWHASDESEDEGDEQQRQERVDAQLGNHEDERHDREDEDTHQRQSGHMITSVVRGLFVRLMLSDGGLIRYWGYIFGV